MFKTKKLDAAAKLKLLQIFCVFKITVFTPPKRQFHQQSTNSFYARCFRNYKEKV